MTKILFICHGNICRSPMAEFIMRDMAEKQNRESDFYIESAAVSSEELGNPVHYGTAKILTKMQEQLQLKEITQQESQAQI